MQYRDSAFKSFIAKQHTPSMSCSYWIIRISRWCFLVFQRHRDWGFFNQLLLILELCDPESTPTCSCKEEKHGQNGYQLQSESYRSKPVIYLAQPGDVENADIPGVLPFAYPDLPCFLLLAQTRQLEISIVMQWTTPCSSEKEKEGYTDYGYEIEREEENEFCNLAEGER